MTTETSKTRSFLIPFGALLVGTLGLAPGSASAAETLKLKVVSPMHAGKTPVTITGEKVTLKGSLGPYTAGDQVLIKAFKRGSKAKRIKKVVQGTVGQTAEFELSLKLFRRGGYTVQAQRMSASGKGTGKRARAKLLVVKSYAGKGTIGANVSALQSRLKKLGYLVNVNGRYDGTTARAVLAFRKVNRMSRKTTASGGVFRLLARGKGAFKLRYPNAGKHVEFDWSRQVVVMARGGKPVMTLHTSSGKASTPTDYGKFRFWLKQPGYNQKRMYYSVYFNGGQAIHGFDPVPNQPASHGCLRIPIASAIRIYNWIDLGDTIYTYR